MDGRWRDRADRRPVGCRHDVADPVRFALRATSSQAGPRALGAALLCLSLASCSGSSTPRTAPTAPAATPDAVTQPSPAASPSPSPTTAPTPSHPAPPPGPQACTAAQLHLSVQDADSGAGQAHQRVLLRSSDACELVGYPGVSFLDAAGRQLGSPADRNAGPTPRLALGPGRVVSAVLTISNANAYPDSRCRPQEATALRVYPPGLRTPLTVPDQVLVCSATGSGQLHIGPLQAGTG